MIEAKRKNIDLNWFCFKVSVSNKKKKQKLHVSIKFYSKVAYEAHFSQKDELKLVKTK